MRPFVTVWAVVAALSLAVWLLLDRGQLNVDVALIAGLALITQATTIRSERNVVYSLSEVCIATAAVRVHTGFGLLAFAAGVVSVELLIPRHRGIRGVFNGSMDTFAASCALAVAALIDPTSTPAAVLTAGAAAVTQILVCTLLVPAAAARHAGTSYFAQLHRSLPLTANSGFGVTAGMLAGGLAMSGRPALLVMFLVSIPVMFWSIARERGRLTRDLMHEMLSTITELQRLRDPRQAEDRLVEATRRLTDASRAWIATDKPVLPHLTSVELALQHQPPRWLVADPGPPPVAHVAPADVMAALAGAAAAALDSAQLTSRLQQQATRDPLTGLFNRRAFDDALAHQLARAQRTGLPFAVCYLDLDRFKPINDTYGHDTGDQLLTSVAERLAASLRAGDLAGRLGGDEFAVLLTGMISPAELDMSVLRLLDAIRSVTLLLPDGTEVSPECSAGASLYPHDGESIPALLAVADARMYERKRSRRALGVASSPR